MRGECVVDAVEVEDGGAEGAAGAGVAVCTGPFLLQLLLLSSMLALLLLLLLVLSVLPVVFELA